MLYRIFVAISLCFMAQDVEGQKWHLQKDNPNQIYLVYSQQGDCMRSYRPVVIQMLTQSRIESQQHPTMDELYFEVALRCLFVEAYGIVFYNLNVHFGTSQYSKNNKGDEVGLYTEDYSPPYGSLGVAPYSTQGEWMISDKVRTSVGDALVDYLAVNFD